MIAETHLGSLRSETGGTPRTFDASAESGGGSSIAVYGLHCLWIVDRASLLNTRASAASGISEVVWCKAAIAIGLRFQYKMRNSFQIFEWSRQQERANVAVALQVMFVVELGIGLA